MLDSEPSEEDRTEIHRRVFEIEMPLTEVLSNLTKDLASLDRYNEEYYRELWYSISQKSASSAYDRAQNFLFRYDHTSSRTWKF